MPWGPLGGGIAARADGGGPIGGGSTGICAANYVGCYVEGPAAAGGERIGGGPAAVNQGSVFNMQEASI